MLCILKNELTYSLLLSVIRQNLLSIYALTKGVLVDIGLFYYSFIAQLISFKHIK